MVTKGIYKLDIQNGKYNLGCIPNIIIDRYIHSIDYQNVMIELDNHFVDSFQHQELIKGAYSLYGHAYLLEKFYERIDELKSDSSFIAPKNFYENLTSMLTKMEDDTYIPNYKNPIAKLITDQIDYWLTKDLEADYVPCDF
jgi:predicted transcriptional regulator